MIAFASFYLGLVLGLQPVRLIADQEVYRVELRLDDRAVAAIEAPPWSATIDFGEELLPHELKAVAFDGEGREIGSARQWINLPQPAAEAELLIEGSESGTGAAARVTWESSAAQRPTASRVVFDGQELEVPDPSRFELPPHDPEQLHYLRVELEFADNVHSVAEATFGGAFHAQLDLQQTAVPLLAEGGGRPLTAATVAGSLLANGEPLRVLAVDEGPAEVIIVRDASAQPVLDHIARRERGWGIGRNQSSFRFAAPLKKNQRTRLVSPFAVTRRGGQVHYELFAPSSEFSAHEGGLFWLLLTERPDLQPTTRQRLADALGVAGMMAAARGRRRAVVLLLGDDPQDASQISAADVRSYLRALRVPLFVWSVAPARAAAEWGEASDVSSLPRFERRVRELTRHLERQRIVWVEGFHLPQRLGLASERSGLAFAR